MMMSTLMLFLLLGVIRLGADINRNLVATSSVCISLSGIGAQCKSCGGWVMEIGRGKCSRLVLC